MTRLIAALTLFALLASCGGYRDSKLNPRNWFGRDREQRIAAQTAEVVDPRGLVAEIVALKVDRLPDGAIVSVVGRTETQGYWSAELVPLNNEKPDKSTLIYEFRLLPPPTTEPVGQPRTREVIVGHFVSTQKLEGVRNIEVIARSNRRSVRR